MTFELLDESKDHRHVCVCSILVCPCWTAERSLVLSRVGRCRLTFEEFEAGMVKIGLRFHPSDEMNDGFARQVLQAILTCCVTGSY